MAADAKYVAWIDSDIAFENDDWVKDSIAVLSKHDNAFGQLWKTCDMLGPGDDKHENPETLMTVTSFSAQHASGKDYSSRHNTDQEYWHPGFAWIATISAVKKVNGLIDKTLGSADRHMAMSFLGLAVETVPDGISETYLDQVLQWQDCVANAGIELVNVPCHISHYWHGPMRRRLYMERWKILVQHR